MTGNAGDSIVSCQSGGARYSAASAGLTRFTSNSWEYTGDGHSLAYHAGAALMIWNLCSSIPLGMIWPPAFENFGYRRSSWRGRSAPQQGRKAIHVFDEIPRRT